MSLICIGNNPMNNLESMKMCMDIYVFVNCLCSLKILYVSMCVCSMLYRMFDEIKEVKINILKENVNKINISKI